MELIPNGHYRFQMHDGTVVDGTVTNSYHMDQADMLHVVLDTPDWDTTLDAPLPYRVLDAGLIVTIADGSGKTWEMIGTRLADRRLLTAKQVRDRFEAHLAAFPYTAPTDVPAPTPPSDAPPTPPTDAPSGDEQADERGEQSESDEDEKAGRRGRKADEKE